MNRSWKLTGVLAAGLGLAACDLEGPGLTENPNQPVVATTEQLYIAMQARQFVLQQGQLARQSAIWTQQVAGIFNQQKEWGSTYNVTENDISTHYNGVYIGGGLVDLRRIRREAAAAGNVRLEAFAKIWEALNIGTATSLWGDIAYREAVNAEQFAAPRLDPQEQVYADIQALLTEAIGQLQGAPTTPMGIDLIYNGDSQRWIRAAHTLKARYHLHTGPRLGQAAYQLALQHAQQGINEPPANPTQAMHGQAPGDFRALHGNTLDDANIWSQFLEARSDLAAHQTMITVLQQRNDPRLDAYFTPAGDGQWRGANQWGEGPGPWGLPGPPRTVRTFRQPFITWAETQLIMAEAHYQLGQAEQAREAVNRVRTAVGMPALPAPITLEQIMLEKWIAQFQNVDAYSDFRRTCFPRLIPGGPNIGTPAARVPGRLPYGVVERLDNPNVPPPGQQPADVWAFAQTAPNCPHQ
jgi:starch-binding outer membrane protein, SusD/RagB family